MRHEINPKGLEFLQSKNQLFHASHEPIEPPTITTSKAPRRASVIRASKPNRRSLLPLCAVRIGAVKLPARCAISSRKWCSCTSGILVKDGGVSLPSISHQRTLERSRRNGRHSFHNSATKDFVARVPALYSNRRKERFWRFCVFVKPITCVWTPWR